MTEQKAGKAGEIRGLFASPGEWFPFDPDNRKDPPTHGLYCCRCNKRVEKSYKAVDVDWEKMAVRNNPLGKSLIGNDCWNKVIKP